MTETIEKNRLLALGELRGLLAAFAWVNNTVNHSCAFTVEELPAGADVNESLAHHFSAWTGKISVTELGDWYTVIGETLLRWLFQLQSIVNPKAVCAFNDDGWQLEMIGRVLDVFIVGVQPLQVWRVRFEPKGLKGFYECNWDDFAIRGSTGLFFLHLGVSD